MKRICCYCYKLMGTKPPYGGKWAEVETHGICDVCMEREVKELDELLRKNRREHENSRS